MSYELPIMMLPAVEAAADLSNYQFHAVKIDSSGDIALSSTAGEKAIGILQNKPEAAGRAASVLVLGISKAVAGGTVVPNDPVGPDASGHLIKLDEDDEAVLGRCMVGAAVNETFPVILTHEGSAAEVSDVTAMVANGNYSATGQNLMMKVHTTDGEFIKCSVAGENVLGVLTNAPAAAATGLIKTFGEATITAGAGGVTAGDMLSVDAAGKLVTAIAGDVVVGYALAAILADATGAAFLMPSFIQAVAGTTLAATNFWVGNAGGAATAVAMGGEATMDNAGAVTIAADAVGVAEMSSTVVGTDGCIFKSSQTPDAVTELDMPRGNVLVGTAGDVGLLDMGAAAGNIMVDDGTDPVSVTMSVDATLAAGGALTIANDAVGAAKMSSAVAGTDGAIFKSSQTPDDVAELDVPRGNLVVGDAGDVGLLDMGAAAGNILVDDGTDPVSVTVGGDITIDATGDTEVVDLTMAAEAQGDLLARGAANWAVLPAGVTGNIIVGDGADPVSVAMSGDSTIVAGGAVTLAKQFMRQLTTTWTSVEIRAIGTPLVLADFSALLAAGLVAAGDALIFHDLVANVYGGVAYDQNENSIIRYQTAAGGAIVSNTLVNWFNGAADGACTTIKQLVTDVVPEINEDLVWLLSADPFAAAGTRGLSVTLYYSVFTPAT